MKLIEWSDEDGCFVGQCPGIIGPCCHGDDETAVYAELCQIVDEWIEIMKSRRRTAAAADRRARSLAEKILADVKGVGVNPRPPA